MNTEQRLEKLVRALLANNLAEAEKLIMTCGDDPEHEKEDDEGFRKSMMNLAMFCKISIALENVRKSQSTVK